MESKSPSTHIADFCVLTTEFFFNDFISVKITTSKLIHREIVFFYQSIDNKKSFDLLIFFLDFHNLFLFFKIKYDFEISIKA